MTERLYYTDPDLLEFESEIVETGREGDRYFTILRASAFYPTSGGQQFDLGLLNDIPILEVAEDNDHEVRHLTRESVGKAGDRVNGRIDRERRMRHRRQHTAQHILSQAFIQKLNAETVSVHLGEEYGAVELNSDSPDETHLDEVEAYANQIVATSLPVEILFVEGEAVDDLPLRKIPARSGPLRVIKVGEFDYSACGGTHCNNTSQVLCIKLVGTEKIRGHTLVKFLSGEEALADYISRYRITNQLSQSLTCHFEDLPAKYEKLSEENHQFRKELTELQKEMLPIRVKNLASRGKKAGEVTFVAEDIGSFDKKMLSQLAGAIAAEVSGVVLLHSDGRIVISASEQSGCDAGRIARELAAQHDLKGGGSARQAQLGGASAERLPAYITTLTGVLGSHD